MQHTVSKMAHKTAVMEHDIAGYLRSHQEGNMNNYMLEG
jgi:hypothetical protein